MAGAAYEQDHQGSTHTFAAYTAGTASSEMSSVALRKAKACSYVVTAGNMSGEKLYSRMGCWKVSYTWKPRLGFFGYLGPPR